MLNSNAPSPQQIVESEIELVKAWVQKIVAENKRTILVDSRKAVDTLGEEIASDVNNLE